MRPNLSRAIFHPWAVARPPDRAMPLNQGVLSPDFVSLWVPWSVPAPNTYGGSRPIGDGPTKRMLRDLETHRYPHADPFRSKAECRSVRQLSSGSGEGQDTASHVQWHRYYEGAGRSSNQSDRLPRLRPSTWDVVFATVMLALFWYRSGSSGMVPVMRVAWPSPPCYARNLFISNAFFRSSM